MKTIMFFIVNLLVIKNAYSQHFVIQRVKYESDWEKVLINKKVSTNYVEIRDLENNFLVVIDSNDFELVDAKKNGDSLELFYKTNSDKIIVNKVKLPVWIEEKESLNFEYKFLRYDPLYRIKYDLSDTLIKNDIHQEFLKVYNINNIALAINDRSFLRGFKNNKLIWELFKFQAGGMFDICASHNKREIADTFGNRALFLYYNSGGFWKASKNYLLEIDIYSGEVLFKSPFKNNLNAFYLKNGDIVFVSTGHKGVDNDTYVYNRKTKKVEYNFFGSTVINAILIRK